MTISSTTRKAGPFVGDASATSFSFDFKCFARSDIVATLTTILTGVEQTLVLDTDYTVTLNADQDASPGGSVTYNPSGTPMASTMELTLTSAVPETQATVLTNAGGYFPKVIEHALDRCVVLVQQLALRVNGALRVSVSDSAPAALPSAAARANMFLAFDNAGDPVARVGSSDSLVSSAMIPVVGASTLAAARTAMGVAAGGAGDVWVEKAGDTMTGDLRMTDANPEYRLTSRLANQGGLFRRRAISGVTAIEGKAGGGWVTEENTAANGLFGTVRTITYFLSNYNRGDTTNGTYPNGGQAYNDDSDAYLYAQNVGINSDNNLRQGGGVGSPLDTGPVLTLGRDVANPPVNSLMANITFGGRGTGSGFINVSYGSVGAQCIDPTSAAPRGEVYLATADPPATNGGNTPRFVVGWGAYTKSEVGASSGGDLGKKTINCDAIAADLVYIGLRASGIPVAHNAIDAEYASAQGQIGLRVGYKNGSYQPIQFYTVTSAGFNGAATGMTIGANSGTGRSINAGGTINASGADYAEYMLRRATCGVIKKGDIVGIDENGELTDKFAMAHSFVVKSTDPAYVGNDKWATAELVGEPVEVPAKAMRDESEFDFIERRVKAESDKAARDLRIERLRARVDRIAFSGQVPVNVWGARPGDYILPMNSRDGGIEGLVVPPGSMTFDFYRMSIGRVWKVLHDGRAWITVKQG